MQKLRPLLLVCLSLLTQQASAQSFAKGTTSFSLGYGLFSYIRHPLKVEINGSGGNDLPSIGNNGSLGPYYFKIEHGFSPYFGVGVNVAYMADFWKDEVPIPDSSGAYTDTANFTTNRTTYSILARLNVHLPASNHFDFYAGLGLGYRYWVHKSHTDNPNYPGGQDFSSGSTANKIHLGFELSAGMRWLITRNLGLYGELGLCKSMFQLGLVYNIFSEKTE